MSVVSIWQCSCRCSPILQHLAQVLPQPEVLPLCLITLGIAIAHEFVRPPLEPVGSPTAHSVLIIVWHWECLYPLLLAQDGLWRRGRGNSLILTVPRGKDKPLSEELFAVFDITHSRVKARAFLMEKSFFFPPSLTAVYYALASRACGGMQSVSIATWDVFVMERSNHKLILVTSVLGNTPRKERNYLQLQLSWGPGALGSGGSGWSVVERNCSLSTWDGFTLAGWQMPTLVLGPLLTGASPADNTWTQTSKTPPQRAVQAAGVPTPSEVLAAAYHTALWLETKTIDQLVQQGTSFFVKKTVPQEILGGFCTCLCLFPFLN